jgi:prolyl oligopeptidase
VTEDDRYLVITAANSTYGNELYIKDLTKPNSPIVTIVDNFKSDNNIIENEGGKLFIETDLNAPTNASLLWMSTTKTRKLERLHCKTENVYLHQQVAVISLQIT